MRKLLPLTLCGLLAIGVTGCGDLGDPMQPVDTTPPSNNQQVTSTTGAAPDYTLVDDVQPIFDRKCTRCHGDSGGLSLESGQAYANLINVDSHRDPSVKRVVPGDADNSLIVQRTMGGEMPPSGIMDDADKATIEAWVNDGACLDATTCP